MAKHSHFDVNLLRVFLAVCRTKSYTLAAEELDLTQPSVSNAISRFKLVVGDELFVRAGRNIKPTLLAQQLCEQLDDSFTNIEQTILGLDGFDPMTSKRQFVIVAGDVATHFLQSKLEPKLEGASIELIYMEVPTTDDEVINLLQREQADVVIDIGFPKNATFATTPFIKEKLVCVVREGHPRIHSSISTEQYFSERHVKLLLRRNNLSAVDLFTPNAQPSRREHSRKSTMLSILDTVSKSDAIGSSAERYALDYAEQFNLQVLPVPFDSHPIIVDLIWKKKLNKNPAHMWLRQQILSIADEV